MNSLDNFKKSEHWQALVKNKNEGRSYKETFTEIFESNLWGSAETRSGPASQLDWTNVTVGALKDVIQNYDINSMLDIPCGDANWIWQVFELLDTYVGADIVEQAAITNSVKYASLKNVQFISADIVTDKFGKFDIVMTRDLFMHLSNANVLKALDNIKASGSKFLFVSSDRKVKFNEDTFDGGYRPINLAISPFDLGQPIQYFEERQLFTDDFERGLALFAINN